MDTIMKFYQDGGAWMHPITFMSIIGLGIMIERFIFLYFKHKRLKFMQLIQKAVMANNIDKAIKWCNAESTGALPRVIKVVRPGQQGPDEIQARLRSNTEIVPVVTKRTTVLQQVAIIATLLGLLGTILGLITAFEALATPGLKPEEKQTMLQRVLVSR